MPSVAIPARSEASETTTLWPIAATGSLPVCLRLMVNLLHDDGTVMEPTSNCMASSPSIVVLQLLTTAAGLASPVAVVASAGGTAESGPVAPVAGVAGVVASDVAAGGAAEAGACAGSAAGGACWSAAGGERSPQAASASAQAIPRVVIFAFIRRSPGDWPDDFPAANHRAG